MVQWPIDPTAGLIFVLQALGWAVLVALVGIALVLIVVDIMRP